MDSDPVVLTFLIFIICIERIQLSEKNWIRNRAFLETGSEYDFFSRVKNRLQNRFINVIEILPMINVPPTLRNLI